MYSKFIRKIIVNINFIELMKTAKLIWSQFKQVKASILLRAFPF